MRTYTQILYHVVFGTKYRQPILQKEHRPVLFNYIWGIMKKKRCHLYRINGVEDHLHMVFHLHPSIALASLIKDIKLASSAFIKEQELFPRFEHWQDGYGAFTHTIHDKDRLIEYVKNQEVHHQKKNYRTELIELLAANGVLFEEQYLD